MKRFIPFLIKIFIPFLLQAQSFEIGHRSITYNDPARSRNIPVHIYYPALSPGDNVAVANGQFPLIVFGHGFAMSWSAYNNIWEFLIPYGYFIVFPTTEGSLIPAPNHGEFGKDIFFLNEKMKSESTNPSSPFYQKLNNKSAFMGHSMGGGAAFLASANNSNFNTLIALAPANTSPSAIDTCPYINTQTLIFFGENDGVTPPLEHQLPMYDSLSSDCKTIIGILGGGHCFFANYNFYCATGEAATNPQPTISRQEQHDILFDFLKPYLDFILKDNASSEQIFLDSLVNSNRIVFQRQCINNQLNKIDKIPFHIFPNPVIQNNEINIMLTNNISNCKIEIKDIQGRILFHKNTSENNIKINPHKLSNGMYFIYLSFGKVTFTEKIIVL